MFAFKNLHVMKIEGLKMRQNEYTIFLVLGMLGGGFTVSLGRCSLCLSCKWAT